MKLDSNTLYNEVISHARKVATLNNVSLKRYCQDNGHHYNTVHALLHQPIPQGGKLSVFLKLLTNYINDNYERRCLK